MYIKEKLFKQTVHVNVLVGAINRDCSPETAWKLGLGFLRPKYGAWLPIVQHHHSYFSLSLSLNKSCSLLNYYFQVKARIARTMMLEKDTWIPCAHNIYPPIQNPSKISLHENTTTIIFFLGLINHCAQAKILYFLSSPLPPSPQTTLFQDPREREREREWQSRKWSSWDGCSHLVSMAATTTSLIQESMSQSTPQTLESPSPT